MNDNGNHDNDDFEDGLDADGARPTESLLASHSSKPYSPPSDSKFRFPIDLGFRLPLWAKGLIILGLVGLASIGYLKSIVVHKPEISKTAHAELDPEELAKRPVVKDFTVTDADGKPTTLSSYKGKVVVLSFWASWCTPCLVELPTFAELEQKFSDRGLRVMTVNIDEGDEGKQFAKDFWQRKKFPFPSFFDSTKQVTQQFEIEMLPSNFVIDRHGRLVFSSFGSNDWSSGGTMDFIEGLLQESDQDPAPVAGPDEDDERPGDIQGTIQETQPASETEPAIAPDEQLMKSREQQAEKANRAKTAR